MLKKELVLAPKVLHPKHEVLSPKEAQMVLKKFNAKPEQFPCILASDPMAELIHAKPGDLVKITRESATAGETVYYRFCVEG